MGWFHDLFKVLARNLKYRASPILLSKIPEISGTPKPQMPLTSQTSLNSAARHNLPVLSNSASQRHLKNINQRNSHIISKPWQKCVPIKQADKFENFDFRCVARCSWLNHKNHRKGPNFEIKQWIFAQITGQILEAK